MPSLSIDSKDLNNLGLNLKDILKAVSNSKGSKNEIIKTKKNRKKKKVPGTGNIVGKIDKMNPFPSYIPKMNSYQYHGVGGDNGLGSHIRVEIKSESQNQQQQNKQDDTIKKQLEAY